MQGPAFNLSTTKKQRGGERKRKAYRPRAPWVAKSRLKTKQNKWVLTVNKYLCNWWGNDMQKWRWKFMLITFCDSIFSINSDRKTQVDCTEAQHSESFNAVPCRWRMKPTGCLFPSFPSALPPLPCNKGITTSIYMPTNHAPHSKVHC
jgi:hypothetical protein